MTFEQKLSRLEELSALVKNPEISIEDALSGFEEGIKLSKSMKNDIDKIEGKIQMLMNHPSAETQTAPILDLFSSAASDEDSVKNAPEFGLRQF